MAIQLRYDAQSDKGLVRSNNEDAHLENEDTGILAVCDGLGGHAAGEIASQIAVDALQEHLERNASNPREKLRETLDTANRLILKDQRENPNHVGMGTTLSCLWIPDDRKSSAWIAHVGDSRVYRLRDGKLVQLTDDHSPVFRLYKEGAISKDQVRQHPQKNLIERSLGLASSINSDIFEIELREGDCFLLCTDGLSDSVSDDQIKDRLQEEQWDRLCASLVQDALDAGGFDNITLIVARVDGIPD